MNWSKALRIKAAELFENGLGYKAASSELGINRETVRDWSYTWRALGPEGLLMEFGDERVTYDPEVKLAVALDRLNGMGVVDVMAKYHIPNRHRVKEWVGMYKKKGAEAFGIRDEETALKNVTIPSWEEEMHKGELNKERLWIEENGNGSNDNQESAA